jgi:hypothetical protein
MNDSASTPRQQIIFDDLSVLAVADPAKFEALRKELIDRVINIPGGNPDKLAALQSRLDEERDTGISHYFSCMRLSEWLHEPYQQITQQSNALDCNNKALRITT